MQRHGWAGAGQGMHLPRVAELVFNRDRGRKLNEFSKTSPGVGETPGGQLDIKIVESTMYQDFQFFGHANAFPVGRWTSAAWSGR